MDPLDLAIFSLCTHASAK